MPQLNPGPWFMILVFAWAVLLIAIPPKILAHTYPNQPAQRDNKASSFFSWNQPWT